MRRERLQILVSREQRHRLEAEAKRRKMSVGAFIRDAIEARLGGATPAQRLRAVAEIRAMSGGRFLAPEVLERIVEAERERGVPTNRTRR